MNITQNKELLDLTILDKGPLVVTDGRLEDKLRIDLEPGVYAILIRRTQDIRTGEAHVAELQLSKIDADIRKRRHEQDVTLDTDTVMMLPESQRKHDDAWRDHVARSTVPDPQAVTVLDGCAGRLGKGTCRLTTFFDDRDRCVGVRANAIGRSMGRVLRQKQHERKRIGKTVRDGIMTRSIYVPCARLGRAQSTSDMRHIVTMAALGHNMCKDIRLEALAMSAKGVSVRFDVEVVLDEEQGDKTCTA